MVKVLQDLGATFERRTFEIDHASSITQGMLLYYYGHMIRLQTERRREEYDGTMVRCCMTVPRRPRQLAG